MADAKDAEIKASPAKGQIEQAFALRRQQAKATIEAERAELKQTEERAKRYALDGELARALAAQPPGSRRCRSAHADYGGISSRSKRRAIPSPSVRRISSRSAPGIAAQLGRPEYSHFLRPNNPGGGTQGELPPVPRDCRRRRRLRAVPDSRGTWARPSTSNGRRRQGVLGQGASDRRLNHGRGRRRYPREGGRVRSAAVGSAGVK